MRLENIKEEFPKMPDDIRKRIEDEVARQLQVQPICAKENTKENVKEHTKRYVNKVQNRNIYQTKRTNQRKNQVLANSGKRIAGRKMTAKKAAIIFLAAALAVGTTTIAGSAIYKMYNEKIGNYAVGTRIQANEDSSIYGEIPKKLEGVNIVNHYIPEGMVQPEGDPGKMFYEETPYLGGVSMVAVAMDTKVTRSDVMMVDKNVKVTEKMDISGHEAVYIEKNGWPTDDIWFDKKIYVIYPESWSVLEIFGGSDISKEEMIKVVENTELQPTGEIYKMKDLVTWSDWVTPETFSDEMVLNVSRNEIAGIYEIGEEFELIYMSDENAKGMGDISAKVTEVQVTDSLDILGDSPYIEDAWKKEIGEDGKFKQAEIQYIKSGDGIDTVDELIKTEMVNQKLVYITVEYTNNGEEMLENIFYQFTLAGIREVNGEYVMYDRAELEPDAEWDTVYSQGEGWVNELRFYDLHSGERDNNYIPLMNPGETITVHFAQIVNEDEMQYMYLNLGAFSAAHEFTKEALNQGYVDIRQ